MSYEITATRKRPQTFQDLAGQEFVSSTLCASISSGRIAHAYLFSGPRGCGKTSTARILARSLNCEKGPTDKPCGVCDSCKAIAKGSSLDVIEIDGASNTSVENIRQIKDEVLFPPNSSRYKIYIIDEVHMLSNNAFNALLKTIEEPPPYIIFIFATTELHKVPATIKSRCQQFSFRLFSLDVIMTLLKSAATDLNTKIDDGALLWIAREATGSMRDAYTLFDQINAFSDGNITEEKIRDKLGLVGSERMGSIFSLCVEGKRSETFDLVNSILESGVSVEQFVQDAISYTRSLLFILSGVEKESLLGAARSSFPNSLITNLNVYQLENILSELFNLYRNMRYSVNPRWELELVISRMCSIKLFISKTEIKKTMSSLKEAIVNGSAYSEKIASAFANSVNPQIENIEKKNDVEQYSQKQILPEKLQVESSSELQNITSQNENIENPQVVNSTIPNQISLETENSIDWNKTKTELIVDLNKTNIILATCLERTGTWICQNETLTISCASTLDSSEVAKERLFLINLIKQRTGKQIKIDITVFKEVESVVDIDQKKSNDSNSVSQVSIVEQAFKGQRIGDN